MFWKHQRDLKKKAYSRVHILVDIQEAFVK